MSRSPFTVEQRVQAAIDYLNGTRSSIEISRELGISDDNTIRKWAYAYKLYDIEAFLPKARNNSYSKEFKIKVVEEYIDGKGSLDVLAIEYKIPAKETLRRWIMKYNSDIELKDYDPKQEVYMAEARRKTSIEERIEIANYCIDHNKDYKNTAEKYNVSYSQVYSWTKKYNENGEHALADKRGRHKSDEEVNELEKLRRENNRLKRQIEERDMTVELLKKVKEFERRRF